VSLDPWKLSKPTVVLMGMAESTRHLAPWDNPEVEIWGINESYKQPNKKGLPPGPYMRRWDRWFQIHPRWDFMREGNFNHPNHPWWMTNKVGRCYLCGGTGKNNNKECEDCKGTGEYDPKTHRREEFGYPFPIYTIKQEDDVPGSAAYPLDEIMATYGANAMPARWFTNSFGIMVALALHLGAKRIEAYGFEMSSKTEYGDQKPNADFWAGICIGRGVEFHIPDGCVLLGHNDQLYGFEKVPGLTPMHMEIMVNALGKAFAKAQAEVNMIRGRKNELLNRSKATKGMSKEGMEKMQKDLQAIVNEEFSKISELNSLFGALQQSRRIHAEVLMHASIAEIAYMGADGDRKVMSLGEFEADARKELEEMKETSGNQINLREADLYGADDA